MSATPTTSPSVCDTSDRIDASCRLPLLVLLGGAAFWLALSSVFGLLSSMTFHKPTMFANCAMLSFGRAFPAANNLLVYGFCIPAGLAVGLWLIARLGRVRVANFGLLSFGANLWHCGVLVGLVAILAGETTGHEWFEMPRYATVILFFAFLIMAVCVFTTYTRRTEEATYPSQWFVLAALFWFPWILSTAILLLQFFPVRGAVQASIAWWFAGNLLNVWLSLAGLAATLYLLPKYVEKPLQSYYVALFAFWTLVLFGTWTGIPGHASLPAWMPSISGMASLMFLIPALAIVTIMLSTVRGAKATCAGGPLCFTKFGVWCFVLSGVLLALTACPQIHHVTDFTWYGRGENVLRIYGFFAMTMFAAVYHILPHIGLQVPEGRVRTHFRLSIAGVALFALPLIAAGVLQGMKMANASVPFADVVKASLMPFRLSTVGELLLLIGSFLFLFNIVAAIVAYYRCLVKTAYETATAELRPAGVKS